MTTQEAYSYCRSIATEHYENFPVASFLVPSTMRDHLCAIYAFARKADDIADEGASESHTRLAELRDLRTALRLGNDADPVFVALMSTITSCSLPRELFDRLLTAFERDVEFVEPRTWDDVLEYCHYSANPVGELFLRLHYGGNEPPAKAIQLSNDVCTALQITNFLQDVCEDLERGRNYLPVPDEDAVERTQALYKSGSGVLQYLNSCRLKAELWSIIHGGKTMLHLCRVRKNRNHRPTLSFVSVIGQLLRH